MTSREVAYDGGCARRHGGDVRLRRLVNVVRGLSYQSSDFVEAGQGFAFVNLRCVGKDGEFSHRGLKWFNGPADDEQRVRPGDLLLANTDLTPGGQIVGSPILVPDLPGEGVISLDLSKLIVDESKVDRRYLYYALSTEGSRAFMRSSARGTTVLHLDVGRAKECLVPLPSLSEQRSIAAFLDVETRLMREVVARKNRLIDLLEERVDSEIMGFIGGSRIAGGDGLAAVPIRRLLRKKELRPSSDGEMITAFRDGEVTSRQARGREGFTNAWTDASKVQPVEIGDVVVHGLDGFSGAIGDAQMPGVCSPVNHVCMPLEGDGAFLGRMLRLLALGGYLGNFATSTRERAVDFRNWDLFGRIPIPRVPVEDQARIGGEIRRIRPLRSRILASESLAAERRRAVISLAIAGELAIPGAAA